MSQTLHTLDDIQQQYRWLQQMRDTQPVWLDEASGCWHVFRYEDVYRVTTDYQLFSSERRRVHIGLGQRTLITLDPPEHRHYRNLVSPAFTPRALTRLSDRVATITQELLDQVRFQGYMDVVNDLAYPLPATVIAEMLGVPITDRPVFKRWVDGLFAQQLSDEELVQPEQHTLATRSGWRHQMVEYFQHMLEERRRQPREDMISDLMSAEVEGKRLNEEEIIGFCTLLLLAGHVTTTSLLSHAIRCFDAHPAAMEQLRAQPDLMPGAIEEVLRYASPVRRLIRTARTAVTINDITIPEGSTIFAWLASANRDREQFPDPERFDITRSPNKHVAFGHGIHFCVGAPLARLETSIALPMMLEQLPNLHIAHEKPAALFVSTGLFGFQHLPVIFTPASPA